MEFSNLLRWWMQTKKINHALLHIALKVCASYLQCKKRPRQAQKPVEDRDTLDLGFAQGESVEGKI